MGVLSRYEEHRSPANDGFGKANDGSGCANDGRGKANDGSGVAGDGRFFGLDDGCLSVAGGGASARVL